MTRTEKIDGLDAEVPSGYVFREGPRSMARSKSNEALLPCASTNHPDDNKSRECCSSALKLLAFQILAVGVGGGAYLSLSGSAGAVQCLQLLEGQDLVHEENSKLRAENAQLKQELRWKRLRERVRPYEEITGSPGHVLPEMYGKVREKTIWSYWHHPETCPSSRNCVLPAAIQLCAETVMRNRGDFDYKIVHQDEVSKYVSPIELPVRWQDLRETLQKDALMNALLARYGGVAMDISTILLRPLDDYWDEMVHKGATFFGYMYRLNGRPWRHAEVTTVWFLMSRREGIFSTAVRNQVIGMGDKMNTGAYHHWYLALGDQTLLPVLEMFNYSLPKCYEDPTVTIPVDSKLHTFPDQNPRWCPEHEQPSWYQGVTGPARNDTRILLRDPRDGPQLPFAFLGMLRWKIHETGKRWTAKDAVPGSPMDGEKCASPKSCWEDVFLPRFTEVPAPGQAKLLSFIKLFHHASEFEGMSREDILADKDTYFYNFLRLAGLDI